MTGSQTTQPVTTQTTSSSPWIGAQPYLGNMYSTADAMRAGGVGYQPYTGPTMAPIDPNLLQGIQAATGTALGQYNTLIPQVNAGLGQLSSISTGVGLPGISTGLAETLGYSGAGLGQFGGLAGTAGNYANIIAAGGGAPNPYLQAVIDAQNRRGNEAIQSSMSAAGRYGSGQYADVMARAQAEVADPLLMQDYEARQQRALQATQGLGQTYGQMAGILQQGTGQAMTAMGMIPGLAQAAYIPSTAEVSANQYMQDYAQQALQGQIAEYNAQQAYPWQQLQRESAIQSGAGTLGGTTVTAQTPLQAPLGQRFLGGALVGGSLGSATGLGALPGAGLGALAGAFL